MHAAVQRVLESEAPDQGTFEWLTWRKDKLTASDCATIIGNAVKGRQRLLDEKRGDSFTSFKGNVYTEMGHINEPIAIAQYAESRGVKVHHNLRPVTHPLYPQLAASLDGLTEDGVVVEIKCLHTTQILKKAKSPHVYQTQYQMACAGLAMANIVYFYVNVLDASGQRLMQVFEVPHDPSWFQQHLPKFLEFVKDFNMLDFPFDLESIGMSLADEVVDFDLDHMFEEIQ